MALLFLYGPPGVGKSTVGAQAAQALALPFVDLDTVIETEAGLSIPQIFAQHGEAEFRARERQALQHVIQRYQGTRGAVVALGGGALLDPANRQAAEAAGPVLVLTADLETLAQRLAQAPGQRPLAQDQEALAQLVARRAAHYASFPRKLDVTHLTLPQTVWEALIAWGAFRLNGMGAGYDVRVVPHGLAYLDRFLSARSEWGPARALVTDANVHQYHVRYVLPKLTHPPGQVSVQVLQPGEVSKSLAVAADLWSAWALAGLDRYSPVVALGGGVVGDVTGFAAATYLRGVPWFNLPTSLLAMVDAAIGGKTGIDLPVGKNLVGAFHAPRGVLVDPETLRTLPTEEWRYGAAEVLKHGLIGDERLLQRLEGGLRGLQEHTDEIVRRAIGVKVRVVNQDPYERTGLRAQLNAGHTVGHAIEAALAYRFPHGAAVAIGLVVEAALAANLGLSPADWPSTVAAWARGLGLPTHIPRRVDWPAFRAALQHDKKRRHGHVTFALPVRVGHVEVGVRVPEAILQKTFEVWHA
ncbi:MAG: 3-dehydroquinate synthase [Chloroflexi bacterium]|nr:3-dehydroquinate synthase [Chloroflexota bacterium]